MIAPYRLTQEQRCEAMRWMRVNAHTAVFDGRLSPEMLAEAAFVAMFSERDIDGYIRHRAWLETVAEILADTLGMDVTP